MVERICPMCQANNAETAAICQECGHRLEQPLARRQGSALARPLPALPLRWQAAGRAVALGAVAVAVEVGAAWLQRRSATQPAPLARVPQKAASPRFVARRRVWETFQDGHLRQRVVEQ